MAVAKAPPLNSCSAPSRERVPSAKKMIDTSGWRSLITSWMRETSSRSFRRITSTLPVRRSAGPRIGVSMNSCFTTKRRISSGKAASREGGSQLLSWLATTT